MQRRDDPSANGIGSGLVERGLGVVASVMLMAIMSLTFCDVLGRYLFSKPIPGAYELVALAMGVLVFSAVPMLARRREFLTIGLFENAIPRFIRPLLDTLLDLLGMAVLALIAWRVWVQAGFLMQTGEILAATGLSVAPFAYFMSAMAALAVLFLALGIGRHWSRGRR